MAERMEATPLDNLDRSLEEPAGSASKLEQLEVLVAVLVLVLVALLCVWLWRLRRWWREQRERHVKVLDEIEMCEPASEPSGPLFPVLAQTDEPVLQLPLNAAALSVTLGCSGREFVDDLDDAENLDILPMTNYGRSGYHRLLAGASGDKHAHTVTRCGLHGHARTLACHCPAHVAQLRSQVGWAQLSRFGGLGVGDDRPRVPLGSPAQ